MDGVYQTSVCDYLALHRDVELELLEEQIQVSAGGMESGHTHFIHEADVKLLEEARKLHEDAFVLGVHYTPCVEYGHNSRSVFAAGIPVRIRPPYR